MPYENTSSKSRQEKSFLPLLSFDPGPATPEFGVSTVSLYGTKGSDAFISHLILNLIILPGHD